jgi:HAD superfamily hydrolase (TIGR01509 family)
VSDFDLVIFDCDGVLIDSERLAVRNEASVLSGLGWPLSEEDIIERFVGRSVAHMRAAVEEQLGPSVEWEAEVEARHREVFERELVVVEGIHDALDRIDIATCVASNGSHEWMEFTLGLTDLYERFRGRIFSADDVDHGKPAPDLFLHAARSMDADPGRCCVVEDSIAGVTAGLAAGMRVFGYAGGVTNAARLSLDGVTVFDDMLILPELLRGR